MKKTLQIIGLLIMEPSSDTSAFYFSGDAMSKPITPICPFCENPYQLGVTGTVEGCDECLGVIRNPLDHTIIFDFNENFETKFTDDEDTLTDLEKA